VPQRIGIEPAPDLLGGPFFVTEHVQGRIPPDRPGYNNAGWLKDDLSPDQRKVLWQHGLHTLADIHAIQSTRRFNFLDEPEDGTAGLDAYLRYVRRWHDWVAGNRKFPLIETAFEYLLKHRPSLGARCVLWGDSRPGNIIFASDGTVSAVLDWEMAALGPAEIDLGWWLMFNEYHVAIANGDPQLPGLPDRDENIAIYEEYSGRKVADMYYFEVLAWLRFAITHIRWRDRMTAHKKLPDDPNGYNENVCMCGLSKQLGVPMPATPYIRF
jgi:aminoglycoside phosphotransferase (APT) family kinase protein